jgi:hypothetical protein
MYTYFKDLEELKACCPIENGIWNKEILKGYMIYCCVKGFGGYIDGFMAGYQSDEALAELLFDFLLNDYYDGSDCQIGAAVYISRMDRELLRRKKDLLLQAQNDEVDWKRPFRENEPLDWL